MSNRRTFLVTAAGASAAALTVAALPSAALALIEEAVPPEVIAIGTEWVKLWRNAPLATRDAEHRIILYIARASDEQVIRFCDLMEAEHVRLCAEGR